MPIHLQDPSRCPVAAATPTQASADVQTCRSATEDHAGGAPEGDRLFCTLPVVGIT